MQGHPCLYDTTASILDTTVGDKRMQHVYLRSVLFFCTFLLCFLLFFCPAERLGLDLLGMSLPVNALRLGHQRTGASYKLFQDGGGSHRPLGN